MDDLIALAPFAGADLPQTHGGVRVAAFDPGVILGIAPFRGQEAALAEALGMPLPGPGRATAANGAVLLWAGRASFRLMGPEIEAEPVAAALAGIAAVTDQSDGWCGLALQGPGAVAVLARLCPLDLDRMPDPGTGLTELAHIAVQVTRAGAGFEILALRSFAAGLLHEVETAMRSVAAQAGM